MCGLMRFEWNEDKNKANKRKHGVSFEHARMVFDDPLQVSVKDCREGQEERWLTMGLAGSGVVLMVAHTSTEVGGEEVIRIISAR